MAAILFLTGMGFCVVLYLWERHFRGYFSQKHRQRHWLFGSLLLGTLLLRLGLGYAQPGYTIDIHTFKAWSLLLSEHGLAGFYENASFADYPPGYMYILYILGKISVFCKFPVYGQGYTLLIKLPSILGDLYCAVLLYWRFSRGNEKDGLADKRGGELGLFLAALYLFMPAVLQNSAIWGQADGFCAGLLFSSLLLLERQKLPAAGVMYALSVAVKPQMLIFAPVYLFVVIFTRKWWQGIVATALGVGVLLGLAVPFIGRLSPFWLVKRYLSTLAYYDYYTVNACNFWALLQKNWAPLPESQSLSLLLTLFAPVLATVLCFVLFYWASSPGKMVFPAAGLLIFTMFTFGVKMHERYLFPLLGLLLLTYGLHEDKRLLRLFLWSGGVLYLNVAYVLHLNNTFVPPYDAPLLVLSAGNVILFPAFVYVVFTLPDTGGPFLYKWDAVVGKKALLFCVKPQKPGWGKFSRQDVVVMVAVTVVFGCTGFLHLGDRHYPQSPWKPSAGDVVVLKGKAPWSSVMVLPGLREDTMFPVEGGRILLSVSTDGQNWRSVGEVAGLSLFTWHTIPIEEQGTYLRLEAATGEECLWELALLSKAEGKSQPVAVAVIQGDSAGLTDEGYAVPSLPGYENGMYFDEIYHGRTALEHIFAVEPYENTHPPLGKLLIGVGIRLWGMTPFGWRFMPALAGALTLPVFYVLLRWLRLSCAYAGAGTILFGVDFIRLTQSRFATLDSFALLFILLLYLSMAAFLRLDWEKTSLGRLSVPLLAGGVCLGLGAAVKWTVVFSAFGVAVLLFWSLGMYVFKQRQKTGGIKSALLRSAAICGLCILFYGLLAFALYFCAFLPMSTLPHNRESIWGSFWNYQQHMLSYHAFGDFTHPFASPWYEWPFAYRSIWYFFAEQPDGTVSTISTLGNPVVCVAVVACLLWGLCRGKALWNHLGWRMAVLGFSAGYLSWTVVPRLTFVYHYLTALPFGIMACSVVLASLKCIDKNSGLVNLDHLDNLDNALSSVNDGSLVRAARFSRRITLVLCTLAIGVFVVFFPVLTGLPVSVEYVQKLQWLPTWCFLP